MKRIAILAAALAVIAVGTMANKCSVSYGPSHHRGDATEEQVPAEAPADQTPAE